MDKVTVKVEYRGEERALFKDEEFLKVLGMLKENFVKLQERYKRVDFDSTDIQLDMEFIKTITVGECMYGEKEYQKI